MTMLVALALHHVDTDVQREELPAVAGTVRVRSMDGFPGMFPHSVALKFLSFSVFSRVLLPETRTRRWGRGLHCSQNMKHTL